MIRDVTILRGIFRWQSCQSEREVDSFGGCERP